MVSDKQKFKKNPHNYVMKKTLLLKQRVSNEGEGGIVCVGGNYVLLYDLRFGLFSYINFQKSCNLTFTQNNLCR